MESAAKEGPHAEKLFVRSGDLFDRRPYWQRERLLWAGLLLSMARVLDRRHATGEARSSPGSRILSLAFDAFLVLVDPEWWRAHPPRELSQEEELRLGELRGNRERMLFALPNDGWNLLAEILHAAVDTFFRAGFRKGLDDCLRLLDLMLEPAGAEELMN